MIADCQNRRSALTEWEREFIGSIFHKAAEGYTLTERQAEKLQQIWDRATMNVPAARQ